MAEKPYPTPSNLTEQTVNLCWRLASEMRAIYSTVKDKVNKADADAAYLAIEGKAVDAVKADSATKATQDGNGKVIADTYALKTSVPTQMVGATSSVAGSAGTVPAPAAGKQNSFLQGNGTWTAISIPTKVSTLTNDSGYITSSSLPTKVSQLTNDSGYLTSHQDLSSYAKITAIPTKVSQLVNDSGYLTTQADLTGYAKTTDIPTKVSQLTNDSGYLTSHQDLSSYAKTSAIPTKVSQLSNDSGNLTTQVNADWNATSGYGVIKNKPTIPTQTSQLTNNSGYITSAALSGYATTASLSNYATTASLSNYATTTALGGKISASGSRGTLAGYETATAGTTVSATSNDAQTGSSITISNGTSGTSWTKIVGLSANATVTLGSSWSWSGGEAPDLSSAGILVCCWASTIGICSFVSGS